MAGHIDEVVHRTRSAPTLRVKPRPKNTGKHVLQLRQHLAAVTEYMDQLHDDNFSGMRAQKASNILQERLQWHAC